MIDRQVVLREQKGQDTQRHVDEEDRPPAEARDQDTAQRRAEGSADRGHGAEHPHGAAGPGLGNRLADDCHGQRHHDGPAQPLQRPGRDQQPERGGHAAQGRGGREQGNPGQQQPAAADDVAQSPDADDHGRDGEQIGNDDPLDGLEGGAERLRQRRQGHVGDAGIQRREQHGE